MSSPEERLRVKFSAAAVRDIRDILRYSKTRWGLKQMDRYQETLHKTFELLSEHPTLGPRLTEGPGDYRVYPSGSHTICYQVQPRILMITRILHQRMTLANHLK